MMRLAISDKTIHKKHSAQLISDLKATEYTQ